MKHFKTLFGTALLGLALSGSPALAANLVVLEASGIDLKQGQVIEGSKILTLEAGQSVSLISDAGQLLQLSGPYKEAPVPEGSEQASGSIQVALANLMSTSGSESSSLGVARSADDVFNMAGNKWLPNPWLIDVSKGGDQCHHQGQPVVFWRPESDAQVGVKVRVGEGVWAARTDWAGGKSKLAVPETMPLLDGETYKIEVGGQETAATLHIVPETVTAKPAQAAWMQAKGCKSQSLAMIRDLK